MSDFDTWEPSAEWYGEDCTCDHDPDEHGWAGCNVDGCECEGSWVE